MQGWQSCKTEQEAALRRVLAPNYLLKISQNCSSPKLIQHTRIVWIGMWFGLTGQEATEIFAKTSVLWGVVNTEIKNGAETTKWVSDHSFSLQLFHKFSIWSLKISLKLITLTITKSELYLIYWAGRKGKVVLLIRRSIGTSSIIYECRERIGGDNSTCCKPAWLGLISGSTVRVNRDDWLYQVILWAPFALRDTLHCSPTIIANKVFKSLILVWKFRLFF